MRISSIRLTSAANDSHGRHVKRGVDKTTLGLNIAIARALAGRDVLLVDGDEKGTAAFTDLRAGALGAPG